MARQGLYRSMKFPTVLGFEGAGDVVELGTNVTNVKVGLSVNNSRHYVLCKVSHLICRPCSFIYML